MALWRSAGGGMPSDPHRARARSDRLLRAARSADRRGSVLRRAFVTAPQNPHAAEALARWHLAADRPELALDFARWAARQRRLDPRYRVLTGDVLARMGRRDEAQQEWRAALRLAPDHPGAMNRLEGR